MAQTAAFKVIRWGSADYGQEYGLRNLVLRRPLGLDLSREDLSGEEFDHHLGAFLGEQLVGVLILSDRGGNVFQMRQVAVAEAFRGLGIGRGLVRFAERFACSAGCREIILHARCTAVDFYRRLGYEAVGESFIEIGIVHQEMHKRIAY